LLWDLVYQFFGFIIDYLEWHVFLLLNIFRYYQGTDIISAYLYCNSGGADEPKKPYEGKGKGKATEEDLRRIEREEKGLPPESPTDEDKYKEMQEKHDKWLATILQQEEDELADKLKKESEEIGKLDDEVNRLKKSFNIAWDKISDGNVTGTDKSKLETEANRIKQEFNKKSKELNDYKDSFEKEFGYIPESKPWSITDSDYSKPEYDNSESEFEEAPLTFSSESNSDPDEGPSTRNPKSNSDPDEGPSTRNPKSNSDSDEERPHKKAKFSHDFFNDSKKIFLPMLYRSFTLKYFFYLIRILLLTLPIAFPEFNFFIYFPYLKEFFSIRFTTNYIQEAIDLHKILKKRRLFVKVSKSTLKCNRYGSIFILTFLILLFFILVFILVFI
jgi:hypothetical protein